MTINIWEAATIERRATASKQGRAYVCMCYSSWFLSDILNDVLLILLQLCLELDNLDEQVYVCVAARFVHLCLEWII